jgi:hypothetical protein
LLPLKQSKMTLRCIVSMEAKLRTFWASKLDVCVCVWVKIMFQSL